MERILQIGVNAAQLPRFEPPVIERVPPPVVSGERLPNLTLPRPIVDVPSLSIDYPTFTIPPQTPPPPVPQIPFQPPQTSKSQEPSAPIPKIPPRQPEEPPPPPKVKIPKRSSKPSESEESQQLEPLPTIRTPIPRRTDAQDVVSAPMEITSYKLMTIAGQEVSLPSPKEIVQASATAVVGTSVTLVTALVFNQARRTVGEVAAKVTRKKFKVRLRRVKPVLHMICENDGVTVVEYSSDGVRTLASQINNPEQFLRDLIETDEFFEADHKIVIDEPIRERFSREGASRFNYFAPSKKLARKLAARFSLG